MYIDPFIAGVLFTIIVEMLFLVVSCVIKSKNGGNEDE